MRKALIVSCFFLAAADVLALDLYRRGDSLALVVLYDNAGGPGWINKSGWLTSNLESWYGITVSGNRVVAINLPNNNLTNFISLDQGGRLNMLVYLNFRDNPNISGGITDYTIFSSLEVLDLTNTPCGIWYNIGILTQLKYLSFWNNGISQVAGGGGGSAVPASIASLVNLELLSLGGNHFTGPFPNLSGMTKLKYLDLYGNELTGALPDYLGNLPLETIFTQGNHFTGPIPSSIWTATTLKAIRLDSNELTGSIPSEVGNLVNLEDLLLNDNQLSGPIPSSIGNLTNLKSLDLGANQLTGSVPTQLNNLVNLVHFSICTNQLSGTLPVNFLTDSDVLQALFICNNNFTGAVPISCLSSPNLNYAALFNGGYTDLPDIQSLQIFSNANSKVEVQNNFLTFEDIEPNRNLPAAKFVYLPQNDITAPPVTILGTQPLSLSFSVGGTANSYQWQKDGVNISGANSATYAKTAALTDHGLYTLVVTNSLVPLLTVKRYVAVSVGIQTVSFGGLAPRTYNTAPFKLAATASSGLPITFYTSNPAVASVNGSTITLEGAGTCTITAYQAGNAEYWPASVEQTLTVNKANQSIIPNLVLSPRVAYEIFDPQSWATSGLPVSYSSSDPSMAVTAGTTPVIQLFGPGQVTITVSQAGDNNFNAAPNVVHALSVHSANAPYTFIGENADPVAQFGGISGLEVDGAGKIYIPNPNSNQVIILNADGSFNKVIGPDVFGLGVSGSFGRLDGPTDIAVDVAGNIYVAERGVHRVSVFTPAGTLLRIIGSRGSASGKLSSPGGIDVDDNGTVYVMESGNNRVSIFNADGTFSRSFGTSGTGNGEFSVARGIDVDGSGNIFVSDQVNSRVQVFANDGTHLLSFGSAGAGDGQFNLNKHIKVDGSGNVFVADDRNARIQKFNNVGVFQTSIAWPGTGGVSGLAVDGSGNIYATNYNSQEVIKFSSTGTVLKNYSPIPTTANQLYAPTGVAFGQSGAYVATGTHEIKEYDVNGTYVRSIGNLGSGDGQLNSPGGLAVDGIGNIYVADRLNGRVQVFDNTGAFIFKFGMGTLSAPYGLTLGPDGVYIADLGNDAIYIYSLTGTLLSSFGSIGSTHGQFDNPEGIAVDAAGNIYVADFNNHRIEIFNSSHVYQRSIGTTGDGEGEFKGPTDVALDANGRIYVLDWNNHNLQVFENNGTYVYTMGSRGTFNNPSKIAVLPNSTVVLITDRGNNSEKVYGIAVAVAKVNSTTLPTNGTHDFGNVNLTANSGPVTFTIESTGNAPVYFNGFPRAWITGAHASDFVVEFSGIVSTIWPGASTSVTVTFTPSAEGERTAQLHIPNTGMVALFNLKGTGVKVGQTITFGPLSTKTFADADFTLTGSATSNLPLTYTSSDPTVATVNGGLVSILSAGTTTITATQAGNGSYNAAPPISQLLNVAKANQVITFAAISAKAFGDPTFDVTATSSSNLLVTLVTSNESVASIIGATVSIGGAGTSDITASQEGNNNYNPAPAVTRTLTVAKGGQTIMFTALGDKVIDAIFPLVATATSNLVVGFSTTSDKVIIAGTEATAVKAGRIIIIADQLGNNNYNAAPAIEQSICIVPAKPTIAMNDTNPESPVLTSSSATGNQWFLNGSPLVGQTNQTITVTNEGTFTVQVKVDDCGSEMSTGVSYLVTGAISPPGTEAALIVYPNPASDQITIQWKTGNHELGKSIVIYDLLGRTVESYTIIGDELTVDITRWPRGNYNVHGVHGNVVLHQRFIRK